MPNRDNITPAPDVREALYMLLPVAKMAEHCERGGRCPECLGHRPYHGPDCSLKDSLEIAAAALAAPPSPSAAPAVLDALRWAMGRIDLLSRNDAMEPAVYAKYKAARDAMDAALDAPASVPAPPAAPGVREALERLEWSGRGQVAGHHEWEPRCPACGSWAPDADIYGDDLFGGLEQGEHAPDCFLAAALAASPSPVEGGQYLVVDLTDSALLCEVHDSRAEALAVAKEWCEEASDGWIADEHGDGAIKVARITDESTMQILGEDPDGEYDFLAKVVMQPVSGFVPRPWSEAGAMEDRQVLARDDRRLSGLGVPGPGPSAGRRR